MNILVLDTIHGGKRIAEALAGRGHSIDMVDVYRGADGISPKEAEIRDYDLVIAPVHLYPHHTLLKSVPAPVITHHQATRWILGRQVPSLLVEITGARGKTTTAHALAYLLEGPGVLPTSSGTMECPSGKVLGRLGITPASLIEAASIARSRGGWVIAEVSLGFTGAGNLGILTSMETYRCAGGEKDALEEKLRSGNTLPLLLTPPGTGAIGNRLPADKIALVDGDVCRYAWEGISGEFKNPLLGTAAYRDPLTLAAAAACILGADPSRLSTFSPVTGRMVLSWRGETAVVDDSNSGTCASTALQAIRYARQIAGKKGPLTLVIGKEEGAICEGFPGEAIIDVVMSECPDRMILVGTEYGPLVSESLSWKVPITRCDTLEEGKALALEDADGGAGIVVLAVKTWR